MISAININEDKTLLDLSTFLGGIFSPLVLYWLIASHIHNVIVNNKSLYLIAEEKLEEKQQIQPIFKIIRSDITRKGVKLDYDILERDQLFIHILNIGEKATDLKLSIINSKDSTIEKHILENKEQLISNIPFDIGENTYSPRIKPAKKFKDGAVDFSLTISISYLDLNFQQQSLEYDIYSLLETPSPSNQTAYFTPIDYNVMPFKNLYVSRYYRVR